MPRLATAATLLAVLPGCLGLGRGQVGAREGNAALTGIVSLPATGMHKGAAPCEGLQVRVTHLDAPESESMGHGQFKLSRGRCLYVVSRLPSNTEVRVEVTPSPAWRCESGAALELVPADTALRLRDYQMATRDFSVRCPAPPAAP